MSTSLKKEISQRLLSDEMQEIINYRPHWFVRKGNFIFLFIVVLLLLLSWVIRYPDTISTGLRLAAVNSPKMLEVKESGKLEKLLVKNGEQVQKGQHIACMQSTASYEQVLIAIQWIEQAESLLQAGNDLGSIKQLPVLTQLGDLQQVYQDFALVLAETKETLSGGFYQRKMASLQKDLQYLSLLRRDATQQQQLISKDYELQKKEYEAYEKLAADKVIAPLELNQYKSKLLAKDQAMSQAGSQITNTDIGSHGKKKEMTDLQKQVFDQQQEFRAGLRILKEKIDGWIQRYVVVAAETGKLEYISFLQENQLLDAGQALFYVLPPKTGYYAELKASQRGFGKIQTGQKVIIEMDGYPSAEYGHIEGIVDYIPNLPSNDSFLIRVSLPHGMVTNYNKQIHPQPNLSASAQIITANKRLADRLFSRLREMLN